MTRHNRFPAKILKAYLYEYKQKRIESETHLRLIDYIINLTSHGKFASLTVDKYYLLKLVINSSTDAIF
jgi:hypothetical protein